MPNLSKITARECGKILISFLIIFFINQSVFAVVSSNEEILLPRVDLLQRGPCPIPAKEIPQKTPICHPKSAVQPASSSISNYTATFNRSYDDVFITALSALEKSPLTVISFDSESGRIFCNYRNLKAIYGKVESTSVNSTIFRITPADGNYNIPLTIINGIFHDMRGNTALGASNN
ncbi:MAG: hypothetical protein WC197_06885 [Candidatus Gastranaerophilaceae bacterium]|jgi:hypothetical protein